MGVFKIVCATVASLIAGSDAKLSIMSPSKLRDMFKDGIIPASYANFGYIPYGHSMVSKVSNL
jgi:hypothetical protein